ncbi:hypothetical protein HGRIS_002906 [Hohenbuehelia grisea]|uniref:Uncharacterized protein n=1 Tax=Hohenbuehelia grisea TaxID=104357 RepID=A0ABR3JM12_9AGAR
MYRRLATLSVLLIMATSNQVLGRPQAIQATPEHPDSPVASVTGTAAARSTSKAPTPPQHIYAWAPPPQQVKRAACAQGNTLSYGPSRRFGRAMSPPVQLQKRAGDDSSSGMGKRLMFDDGGNERMAMRDVEEKEYWREMKTDEYAVMERPVYP